MSDNGTKCYLGGKTSVWMKIANVRDYGKLGVTGLFEKRVKTFSDVLIADMGVLEPSVFQGG